METILTTYSYQEKPIATKRVIFLGMLFVSFLIVSNLTAFKVAEIHLTNSFFVNLPAALIFFPLTYFFDDVLTEVYGFKMSRFIIWGGLICSAMITLCTQIAVHLPASPVWDINTNHGASAYELIFKGSSRIFLASMLAYFCGEFLNSMILAKLKIATKGQYFSLRVMASTAIGVGVDSIIFCNIAFWSIMPHHIIWKIILTQYLFKLIYEFLTLPLTYSLVSYLKKKDRVDYYDVNTKFNPFSISLVD
jgi:queuosine precursor transporter